MNSRNLSTVSVLSTLTLVLAACGGSSESSDNAGGASPFGDDDAVDIVDQVLEDNGIDLDELDLGDGGDLDLDDIADLQDDASDAIDSLSNGSGAATFTIDGAQFQLTGGSCFVFGNDLSLDGAGTTADGQPFWGEVSYTVNDRAEMAESGFDDALLDTMFGDKQQTIDFAVAVDIGRTERFGSGPDDAASYRAEVFLGSAFFGEVTFEKSGSTVTGSGDMVDENGVAAEYGTLLPFEVSASCG